MEVSVILKYTLKRIVLDIFGSQQGKGGWCLAYAVINLAMTLNDVNFLVT